MIAVLGEISRWALVAVFAASLAHKLRDPRAFAQSAGELLAVGARRAAVLGALSAVAEATLLGALLAVGAMPLPYALAAVVLLAYTGVLATALRRGGDASCGCFSASSTVRGADLARNGVLLALTGLGAAGATAAAAQAVTGGRALAALGGLLLGAGLTQASRVLDLIEGTGTT